MRALRIATCVGVSVVLARAVIAQPAEDAAVPPLAPTPDAGVPADAPPATTTPPPTTPQVAAPVPTLPPLPPLPPPYDMSKQFARKKAPYPIERVDRPLVLPSGAT
ncbi:MAG TPA: hypothetical protein VL326_04915, partial [Kofleriaceae bacterium]|nr:hypothetical protein [Kofleriaceae bacterium]